MRGGSGEVTGEVGAASGLDRLFGDPRRVARIELACAALAVVLGALTWAALAREATPLGRVQPHIAALLLVATLAPVLALLVLGARRLVLALSSQREGEPGGRLHLRLVALFAAVAAVPTLVLAAFAALLFQYGVQFWFSDRARTVLVNADQVAQAYVDDNRRRLAGDLIAMAADMQGNAEQYGLGSREFAATLAFQVEARGLTDAAVFRAGPKGSQMIARTGDAKRPLGVEIGPALLRQAQLQGPQLLTGAADRVHAVAAVDPGRGVFLYSSRRVDARVLDQVRVARSALDDYAEMTSHGRTLQLRFGLMLAAVSLLLMGLVIWAALRLATRLASPIQRLVEAARRVGEGDFSARVPAGDAPDEIAALTRTFNRMTIQLEAQNRALIDAGAQIDARRRLTEAVLTGVSAGVIAIDGEGRLRLMNTSAAELLALDPEEAIGRPLTDAAPAFLPILERAEVTGETASEVVILRGDTDAQTFAVRLVRLGAEGGAVMTFDDISQQLTDQRRAAWADVARRIAHEIKNPLTPIQLAAERLQRKFGREVANDHEVFSNLTGTIVRQVGDLRRMVDEFSAFARMPKPMFRLEDLTGLARQALTLPEVAHPDIRYRLEGDGEPVTMPCDRRQIAQALTNLLKNAAEGIEARRPAEPAITIRVERGEGHATLAVEDNGVGLPAEARARLTEPYVTTRARGTGLGLAIVKKIAEDHGGELRLEDAPGGGARVALRFDLARLAALTAADPPTPALAAE